MGITPINQLRCFASRLAGRSSCERIRRTFPAFCFLLIVSLPLEAAADSLHAGAAKVDITPPVLPVIRNGGITEKSAGKVLDPLHARSIVLYEENSKSRVALAIVDSCMIPRTMCDAIKEAVHRETGIRRDHILIAATHTHSAPGVMHYCLGSRADPNYSKFLPPKVVESIVLANQAVQPAQAGWTVFDAADFTAIRRWITRSDQIGIDPFGERTVNANMHPGHQNPNFISESGPRDPWFSLISLQTRDGKPLALLGNFSMHYFGGHPGLSADYFGEYARRIENYLAPGDPAFVGILSQGTSGDAWRTDYSKPKPAGPGPSLHQYTAELVSLSTSALKHVGYQHDLPLEMGETRMTLARRTPSPQRLAWARTVMAALNGVRPRDRPEVYAEQAIYLHENPEEEVVLQAIRLGNLGMTAMPNEVYALTGLKLRARSPLDLTINFSLANGAAGYIPPPEQHYLGGYNTWPARTAGLEVQAEPKLTEATLALLEKASGMERKTYQEPPGDYAKTVAAQKPVLHLRLADMEASPNHEPGLAYHLPGVIGPGFGGPFESRAMVFAGGRLSIDSLQLGDTYSISMWIWNAMPTGVRPVTGYFFSRGVAGNQSAPGDHLGIGGTHSNQGRLILFNGNRRNELVLGRTSIPLRKWSHVVLVRSGGNAALYLNGSLDGSGPLPPTHALTPQLFLGGRSDQFANFEGRLDEVAIFDRALAPREIQAQFKASGLPAPPPAAPRN